MFFVINNRFFSNDCLPPKLSSNRRETLRKRVSNDPQHFTFRHRTYWQNNSIKIIVKDCSQKIDKLLVLEEWKVNKSDGERYEFALDVCTLYFAFF